MTTQSRTYELTVTVDFEYDPEHVDVTHWIDENGEKHHRMEGIYPELVSEDDLFKHLAYNRLVNGVSHLVVQWRDSASRPQTEGRLRAGRIAQWRCILRRSGQDVRISADSEADRG